MKRNEITISIDHYHEMRDLNEAIKKNYAVYVNYIGGNDDRTYEMYSNDNTIKKLFKENEELHRKLIDFEINTPTHKELLNMSLWEFKKWKNNQ